MEGRAERQLPVRIRCGAEAQAGEDVGRADAASAVRRWTGVVRKLHRRHALRRLHRPRNVARLRGARSHDSHCRRAGGGRGTATAVLS